jgi:Fe2+ or Zn2+ uptake regulation protein
MLRAVAETLRQSGVQPSAQRVAVAQYVLHTDAHPSAEQVVKEGRRTVPMLSRATVYNTLNSLVAKGLLRELVLSPGKVVFDPKTEAHHHFVDERTGRILDVPWDAVRVSRVEALPGLDVHEYQVVMRGRASGGGRR